MIDVDCAELERLGHACCCEHMQQHTGIETARQAENQCLAWLNGLVQKSR